MKILRKLRNMTLEEFAEELGLSRSTLQDMERGVCNPTLKTLDQISVVLDISPLALLSKGLDPTDLHDADFILMSLNVIKSLPEECIHHAEALIHQLLTVLKPGFEVKQDEK